MTSQDGKALADAAVAKFRKLPVVIEAMQLLGYANVDETVAWILQGGTEAHLKGDRVSIVTREGTMVADPNDWIIKGVAGEFYPCKPEIFAATYEPAATALRASEVTEAQVDAAIAAADAEAKTFITDDAFAAKFGISSVAGLLCRVMRPALETAALTAALASKQSHAEGGKE